MTALMTRRDGRSGLWRSRWAAIGAALAVTLGGGGLVAVNATSGPASSLVTVAPERILDTRTGLGLSGPFASGVSRKLQVTGAIVPAGATGVLLNVTVVAPSAAGFLSVRPGDATGVPSTSSLNFKAGDITPNSVQVALPTSGASAGQIDITFDAFGVAGPTTNVLADVVGYLVAGGGGVPGPTGATGAPGAPGAAGAAGAPGPAGAPGRAATPQFGRRVWSVTPNITTFTNAVGAGGADVTVGVDGLPMLVTRNDAGFLYPVLVHCNDPLCRGGNEDYNQWASYPAGLHPSVTIGTDGLPVFAHGWGAGNALHITHCATPDCLQFSGTTKFSTSVRVEYPAIAIGRDGMPVVAFRDATNGDVRVVKCDDVQCSATGAGETDALVHSGGVNDVGYYLSMVIGVDGFPIIAFHDGTEQSLKVTHCNDAACVGGDETTTTARNAPGSDGNFTAIQIGVDGMPTIAHFDLNAGDIAVTRCNDIACVGGSEPTTMLPSPADDGWYLDMVLSPEGNPLIASQRSSTSDVYLTECDDPACAGTGETTTFVDGTGITVGQDISITLSADGQPLMVYTDTTNSRVRVAVGARRGWSQNSWGG